MFSFRVISVSSSSTNAGFDINLGKLRLPVGTQVFVAETLGDLVIAIHTGHHQQLLEKLRGLGKREELEPSWVRLGTR